MKCLLLLLVSVFSISVFSQSYFVLENGVTISIDADGFVYDYNHHTPVNRVSIKGGQFLLEDLNVLVTVDAKGNLFRKYEILPENILGKGANYFIGTNNFFYGIDTEGYVNMVELPTNMKDITKYGGNFFMTEKDFFVVNAKGEYSKVAVEALKPSDVLILGGNYFMTNRGVLYTVSNEGQIISQKAHRIGIIQKRGGNFFIDTVGALFTISESGELIMPGIPMSLRLPAVNRLGTNYFMDAAGKLFTVDRKGQVFERWVNHELKSIGILSL